jgi:undecaprenyl-diphosphatase
MKKRYVFIIWAAVLVLSFFLDKYFLLIQNFRNPVLDSVMTAFSFIGSWILIPILVVAVFLWKKQKRWIPVLLIGLAISELLMQTMKWAIPRMRPTAIITEHSFPSGHASSVFSAVPIINRNFKTFKYAWLALAVLISFSRIYLGVHYLSDVVAGGLLGYGITSFFMYLENRNSFFRKLMRKF